LDFLASVGGLLGLCIGLSIVTVLELIWLLLRLTGTIFVHIKMLRAEQKRVKEEEIRRIEAWK
jgi:hypothetical protein